MSIALYPKPIVVGGGVFGEDRGQSTYSQITFLTMDHHENRAAYSFLIGQEITNPLK